MKSESPDNWNEIEKAYCSGTPLSEIRARFGISLGELLARAKARGWKRRAHGAQTDPGAEQSERRRDVVRLPVAFTPAIEATIDAVVRDTAADIAASHKGIAKKLRTRLDLELAEFDEAAQYFARFRDTEHIARLASQNDGGKELRAYLSQCLAHHAERAAMLERLSRIGGQVVDLERTAWNLGSDDPVATTWDDMLEYINKPLALRSLPDNIVQFEEKVLRRRERIDR